MTLKLESSTHYKTTQKKCAMIYKLGLSRFFAAALVWLNLGVSSPCHGAVVMFAGFGLSAFFGDNNPGNGLAVATSDGFNFVSGSDHFHIGTLPGHSFNGSSIR
jgi:hypothetical protein